MSFRCIASECQECRIRRCNGYVVAGADLADFLSECQSLLVQFPVEKMCQAEHLIAAITQVCCIARINLLLHSVLDRVCSVQSFTIRKVLQADREASHLDLSRKYKASSWAQRVDHTVTLASHSDRSPSLATIQQLYIPTAASTSPLAAVSTLMKVRISSLIHFLSTLACSHPTSRTFA